VFDLESDRFRRWLTVESCIQKSESIIDELSIVIVLEIIVLSAHAWLVTVYVQTILIRELRFNFHAKRCAGCRHVCEVLPSVETYEINQILSSKHGRLAFF
jgi:hypothetical protein